MAPLVPGQLIDQVQPTPSLGHLVWLHEPRWLGDAVIDAERDPVTTDGNHDVDQTITAVTDGVGRQFVDDQHQVALAIRGQREAALANSRGHFPPEERQIQLCGWGANPKR